MSIYDLLYFWLEYDIYINIWKANEKNYYNSINFCVCHLIGVSG